MYTKKTYSIFQMAIWTRFETLLFLLIITLSVAAYYFFNLIWLRIPWTPLALIGTAVAFVIGFQNNAAYSRIWEARKIWGGIVNTSRTLGTYIQDMVSNEHTETPVSDEQLKQEIKTITYRHIAWMTALRHSMRTSKPWETEVNHKTNQDWNYRPPEFDSTLEEDLKPYISESDFAYTISKNNKQTALERLKQAYELGLGYRWRSLLMTTIAFNSLHEESEFKGLIAKIEQDMERQREEAYQLAGVMR